MKEKIEETLAGLNSKQKEYVQLHATKVKEARTIENELNQIQGAITVAQALLRAVVDAEKAVEESAPGDSVVVDEKD